MSDKLCQAQAEIICCMAFSYYMDVTLNSWPGCNSVRLFVAMNY